MVTPAYVLSLMLLAVPEPPAAVRATYDATAAAIAEASSDYPLFAGDAGAERTAALIVAVARFESGLQPDAEGDCHEKTAYGTCVKGARPHSFCMLQIHETNLAYLRVTREQLQTDVRACVRAGVTMMRESFRVCARAPLEERLGWYAGGGGSCGASEDAKRKSRHRMALARWLLEKLPYVQKVEPSATL